MTQCERILDYLKEFSSITTLQAFQDLGVTRLASRIHDLGQEGYTFQRDTVTSLNRYGEKVHFTRYSLAKDIE